ncbi:MAG: hypothetical protein PUC06_00700 [Oscillospiraceae bacterium]|nr:hypothetical protein [Oscillospiraceae bacterium]
MPSSKQVRKAIGMSLAVLLCVLIVLSGEVHLYFTHTAYYYQDAEVRRSMAGSFDTLICGASQGYEGIMPTVLDEELGTSSYNISCSMMTMQGRYDLLQKELSRNPVDTVIFEVSYNTITRNRKEEGPEGDIYQLGRLDSYAERISFFFSSFYPSEYGDVLLDLVDRSKRSWHLMKNGAIEEPVQWETKGYVPNEIPTDMTLTVEKLDTIYHTSSVRETPDPENVEIFHQMMELMQERGIRVILVATPLSEEFLLTQSNLPSIMDWYRQQADSYGCEFYDFNLQKDYTSLYPAETAFLNTTHLVESGAETFSRQLARVIRMAEAGEDVSGLFYGSYAEAEEHMIAQIRGE